MVNQIKDSIARYMGKRNDTVQSLLDEVSYKLTPGKYDSVTDETLKAVHGILKKAADQCSKIKAASEIVELIFDCERNG